jgi:hypothetical protein
MKFNKNIRFGFFFNFLLLSQGVMAQNQTNLQVLADLLSTPVVHAVDSLYSGNAPIEIKSGENDEINMWLESQLRNKLLSRNIRLKYETEDSSAKNYFRLMIEKIGVNITYQGFDRDLLMRFGHYRRNIKTLLSFYIINPDESINYSYSKSISYSDTLSRSELNKVEDDFYEFSEGEKTGSRFSQKIIEPVLVTVATIGVVYLFFSLRSGS